MDIVDSLRRLFGRICSWLGYITVIAEFLLLVLLYFQAFVDIPIIKTVLLPKPSEAPTVTQSTTATNMPSEPTWIVPLFAAAALLLIGYGIFHLVTKDAPEAKERAEAAVEKVAVQALKKIEKDRKVSYRRERILTARLIFWLKVGLAVLPLVVVLAFQNTTMSISKVAALFLVSGLSLSAVIWFTFERILSGLPELHGT